MQATIEREGKKENGAKLSHGECGNEGEGVHSTEVGFAIGNVHGSPHETSSNGGDEAAQTVCCRCSPAMQGTEAQHNRGNDDGDCTEHDLGDVLLTRSFELSKEEARPKQTDQ